MNLANVGAQLWMAENYWNQSMKKIILLLLGVTLSCFGAKKGERVDICSCKNANVCGTYKLLSNKHVSMYENQVRNRGSVCFDNFLTMNNFSADTVSVVAGLSENQKFKLKNFTISCSKELDAYKNHGIAFYKIKKYLEGCKANASVETYDAECITKAAEDYQRIYEDFLSNYNCDESVAKKETVEETTVVQSEQPSVDIPPKAIENVLHFLTSKLKQTVACKDNQDFSLECTLYGKSAVIADVKFFREDMLNNPNELPSGRGTIYSDVNEKRGKVNLSCNNFQATSFDIEHGVVEGDVVDYFPTESCESYRLIKRNSVYASNEMRYYVDYEICDPSSSVCENFGGTKPFYMWENNAHFWDYRCSDNSFGSEYCWNYTLHHDFLSVEDPHYADGRRSATFKDGKVKTLELRYGQKEGGIYSFDFSKGLNCEIYDYSENFSEMFKGTCSFNKAKEYKDVKNNEGKTIISADALNVFFGMGYQKTGKISRKSENTNEYGNRQETTSEYGIENGQRVSGKEYYSSGETRVVYGRGSEIHYYKNGNKESEIKGNCLNKCSVTEWFDDGRVHREYSKAENMKSGKELVYYSNGKKCLETVNYRGLYAGTSKIFTMSGNPVAVLQYNKEGLLHGSQKFYGINYEGDVFLSLETNYSKGNLNGSVTHYYANGKRKSVLKYKNGGPASEKTCYNSDGSVLKTGLAHMNCGDEINLDGIIGRAERYCD